MAGSIFLIACKREHCFTSFCLSSGLRSWKSVPSIKKATKFKSNAKAIARAAHIELYLNHLTDFVGSILVVTLDEAKKIYAHERSEVISPEILHKRWCRRYHLNESQECRFKRDIKSLIDYITK